MISTAGQAPLPGVLPGDPHIGHVGGEDPLVAERP